MGSSILLLLLPLYTGAFILPCNRERLRHGDAARTCPRRAPAFAVLLSAKQSDEDDEEDKQTGMAEAFRELDSLDSLDDDDKPKKPSSSRKAIDDFADVELLKNEPKASPEEEVKLYKDMMSESEKEDVELYADMMTDMGGTTPKQKKKAQTNIRVEEEETVELLDSLEKTPEDLDVFMNQALQEALEEAKSKTPEELASINPLDDEEMMDEIKQVFEKANDELLASLEDIRKEQVCFVSQCYCCYKSTNLTVYPTVRRKWPRQVPSRMQQIAWKQKRKMKSD